MFNIRSAIQKAPGLRSVGIYTFSNFFAKGTSFILLFVYTNPIYITPSENGLLNLFSNGLLFLMPFLSMGIVFSTASDFFKMDDQSFRDFFTSGFVMPILVMLLSMLLLWIFREALHTAYGFPYSFAWLIPLITFFTFCHEQLLAVARSNNDPTIHLKTNVAKAVIELGLSFLLVVFFAWRWKGRIAGILFAYIVIALYSFRYFFKHRYLSGKVRRKYLRSEIIYAIPVITMQASLFSMGASDKFFLSHFTNDNNSSVGIYGVACVFASVILLLCNAILQYFFPKLFGYYAEKEINYPAIRKQFFYYAGIMFAGLLTVMAFIFIVYSYFLNSMYTNALSYIYILCTGYFVWSLTYFFYSFLLYKKHKRKLMLLSVFNIVISISSNYYFISHWHARGAAFSVFSTYLIVLLITLFINRAEVKRVFTFR